MLNNSQLLGVIKDSFKTYLEVGTSRSTAKLKTLHGHIANDILELFGKGYSIKSQGIGDDKEGKILGRYYEKNVDITLYKDDKAVAGYAVKFVMRNYSQNSNNYFENMLGETANIRTNNIPYFQIFIIFDKVPYYKKGGDFDRYDKITQHNIDKYIVLSKDNPSIYFHTPDKTLFILIDLKEKSNDYQFKNEKEYSDYYRSIINEKGIIKYSNKIEDYFDDSVILNDYEDFLNRTKNIVLGKGKK